MKEILYLQKDTPKAMAQWKVKNVLNELGFRNRYIDFGFEVSESDQTKGSFYCGYDDIEVEKKGNKVCANGIIICKGIEKRVIDLMKKKLGDYLLK